MQRLRVAAELSRRERAHSEVRQNRGGKATESHTSRVARLALQERVEQKLAGSTRNPAVM